MQCTKSSYHKQKRKKTTVLKREKKYRNEQGIVRTAKQRRNGKCS